VLLLEPVQSSENMITDLERIFLQFLALDHVQHSSSLRAHDWISAKSIEVRALPERGGDFRRGHDRAERTTVTDSFGHCHDIGNHTLGFESPIMCAGAAEARLHFIGDAQTAGAANMFVNVFKVAIR